MLGITVDIFSLKSKNSKTDQLIIERGLQKFKIQSLNTISFLKGLISIIINVRTALTMFLLIIREENLKNILKSIAILPICFYYYDKIRNQSYDFVHFFWGHFPVLIGLIGIVKNKPLPSTLFLGAYDLHYKLGVTKLYSQHVNFIITHSNFNASLLTEQGIPYEKIRVIYRGLSMVAYRKEFNMDIKTDDILTAGRIIEEKGFAEVIRILSPILCSDRVGKLLIAGDGPYLNNLRFIVRDLKIENKVIFLGELSHANLLNVMSKTNYFILLSRKRGEVLPNVIKEAMSMGCLCISSETDGISELIENGVTGLIYKDDQLNRIPKDLLQMDSKKRRFIQTTAMRHIRTHFDNLNSMGDYVKIWMSLKSNKF